MHMLTVEKLHVAKEPTTDGLDVQYEIENTCTVELREHKEPRARVESSRVAHGARSGADA